MDDINKIPALDQHERHIFNHADGVIKNYQATHEEKVPKGIKMNNENVELLKLTLHKLGGNQGNEEITHMRGSQIIIDDKLDLNDIIAIE